MKVTLINMAYWKKLGLILNNQVLTFTVKAPMIHHSRSITKVKPPISNTHRKTNTMYHMHTLGASKCMHVVHSVDFAMGVGDG